MRHSETAVAMVGLAKWVLGGFVLQWAVTALYLRKRLPLRGWLKGPLFHSGVRKLIQAFGLGTLGVGAVQINAFFDAIFARYASPSGPVYLWYANRIQQLALAVLGIAAVTTLVPILTRAIKGGDEEQGRKIYAFGGRRAVMLMIPMTFAIISLGSSAIQLIFGHGSFSLEAINETSKCLSAYALGLLPSTLVMYQAALLYAKGDYRTAAILSLLTVLLNISLNALFVFGIGYGAVSTALATSLGAWFNFWGLKSRLRGWRIPLGGKELIELIGGCLLATALAYFSKRLVDGAWLQFILPALLFLSVLLLLFSKRLFDDRSPRSKEAGSTLV